MQKLDDRNVAVHGRIVHRFESAAFIAVLVQKPNHVEMTTAGGCVHRIDRAAVMRVYMEVLDDPRKP